MSKRCEAEEQKRFKEEVSRKASEEELESLRGFFGEVREPLVYAFYSPNQTVTGNLFERKLCAKSETNSRKR